MDPREIFRVFLWVIIIGTPFVMTYSMLSPIIQRGRRAYRRTHSPIPVPDWMEDLGFRAWVNPPPRPAHNPARALFDLGWWLEEGRQDRQEYRRFVAEFGSEPLPRPDPPPPPDPTMHDMIAALLGDEEALERTRRSVGPT